jgi:signal transduction protein with GAF and PtsI domain
LDDTLKYISAQLKEIMHVDRCSLFIYETQQDQLFTKFSDGVEKIIVPFDMGIVGLAIKQKKSIIENEPYDNPNFMSDIDMKTGYYTKNILAIPIFDKEKNILGVLQLLNKNEDFTKKDLELMTFFCENICKSIVDYSKKKRNV